MAIDLSDELVELKITSVVCSSIAMVMTIARLIFHRAQLWWDDAWVLFSMLCVLVQVASVFMHIPNPEVLSQTSRIAAYYILAATFYAIIWSARLAILLSILRIEPNPAHQRHLRIAAVIFVLAAVVLISQLFWVCEPEGAKWKNALVPQCKLPTQVAVFQVVTDVFSDLFLCIWPLQILSKLRNKRLRRRLKFIFCMSIITTVVSLVHVGYLLTIGGVNLLIAALVEDTVSLIVANVPIVFTAALRRFGDGSSDNHVDLDAENNGGAGATFNAMTMKLRNGPDTVQAPSQMAIVPPSIVPPSEKPLPATPGDLSSPDSILVGVSPPKKARSTTVTSGTRTGVHSPRSSNFLDFEYNAGQSLEIRTPMMTLGNVGGMNSRINASDPRGYA